MRYFFFYAIVSVVFSFSVPSSAQTSINKIEETLSDSTSQKMVVPETLGVSHEKTMVDPGTKSRLMGARKLAQGGATTFFIGLGLEYLVVTPMALVGAANNNPGLVIGALLCGLVASGFEISGPIRNGVGASLAYDYSVGDGMSVEKNNNWTYYKVGWGFTVGSTILSLASSFSSEPNLTLSLIGTTMSIAADAFWLTSCRSSVNYTKDICQKAGLVSLELEPIYCSNSRSLGLQLTAKF
jgi:hypothetical protein